MKRIFTASLVGLILMCFPASAPAQNIADVRAIFEKVNPSVVDIRAKGREVTGAGLAGFTLAAGVAGLYLGMERRLRRKQFRPGGGGLSLQGLDRLHHRLVLLVTPVFTLAIVTGVLWTVEVGGLEQLRGRMFEVAAAGVAWAASLVLLVSRAVWGTRGRSSAWLTLVAFLATVLIVVSYGVRS